MTGFRRDFNCSHGVTGPNECLNSFARQLSAQLANEQVAV